MCWENKKKLKLPEYLYSTQGFPISGFVKRKKYCKILSLGSAKWMSTRCSMSVLDRFQTTPYLQLSSSGLHLNPVPLTFSKMYISGSSSPTNRFEMASSSVFTCVFTCRLEGPGVGNMCKLFYGFNPIKIF